MIKLTTILSQQEIEYLKDLYNSEPKQFHEQDVNLFSVYKTNLTKIQSNTWNTIQAKLAKVHGSITPVTNYFLEYKAGAYSRTHQDNPVTVDGTAVTLVDRSEDLIGGDVVVGKGNQQTIPMQVGQTVYYTTAVDHGVTKVVQGNRIVLITWFRKDTWQK